MKSKTLIAKACFILVVLLAISSGCADQNLALGKWKTKTETHEYVLLTEKDARNLGEAPPGPFPPDNKLGWTMVKEIGKSPERVKQTLKPYSVAVLESGFTLLQSTRHTEKAKSYDDIEWGWKVILENRSKRGIHAYAGYSLFDKDGFVLTAAGVDWDNNEYGVYIKPGERCIIQGRGLWRVDLASKPYPPSRVHSGDYKLFLRHDIFERLADETDTKK